MQYLSAKEVATKWEISQRRVAILCSESRIQGAQSVGSMWIIPADAQKPVDARTLRAKEKPLAIKPFVKWAGGKSQLWKQIEQSLPAGMGTKITKYAEPMVGGGAVLFELLKEYSFDEIFISDVNAELINTYTVIRDDVELLVQRLDKLQSDYYALSEDQRKTYYYAKRNIYNQLIECSTEGDNLEKAALFIFINKTCFNGLYRVNGKGQYNVPIGSYKKPLICDESNLLKISDMLSCVKIVAGDYTKCKQFVDGNTFVYIDPPYRPLNKTSSFTSYAEGGFGDAQQVQLAQFASQLGESGAKVMLSNSDPKNSDDNDNFFDDLYSNFTIQRVAASRMINSSGAKRGKVTELLITNY